MSLNRVILKSMYVQSHATAEAFEMIGAVLPDHRKTLMMFADEERKHAEYLCHLLYTLIFPCATNVQPYNHQNVPKPTNKSAE